MSDRLEELQALRSAADKKHSIYGKISNTIAALCYPSGRFDGAKFTDVMNMISEYGEQRADYAYWNGAICQMIGILETPSEREAREYAEAAAAAGQMEITLPPDPDDPRSMFETWGPAPTIERKTIERGGTG